VLLACAAPSAERVAGLASPPAATGLPTALTLDPRELPVAPLAFEVRRPQTLTLPNGLVVYLVEDHGAPLVLLRLLMPTGSVDDPEGRVGLSALLAEVLVSGGAGGLEAEALEAQLEARAADLGASASEEFSSVSLSVRAGDLASLFPLFSEVVQRPRFDPARVEVARRRAVEAVRRRGDRPESVAARAVNRAVFGGSSLLGRESDEVSLARVTRDELVRAHAEHWAASGARLVISGDFDQATVEALVRLHFGGWKGGALPAHAFESPPKLARRVLLVPSTSAQVKVRIGGPGFHRDADDEYAMRLAASALGSFGVGRLYRVVRDERGLAYSASASVSAGPTTGFFQAAFDTRPGQTVEALRLTLATLEAFGRSTPLTDAELAAARDMAVNAFAFRFDAAGKVGWERALYEAFAYRADYLDGYRRRLGAVTLSQVNLAAQQLTRAEQLQIIVVGPASLAPSLEVFGPVSTITDLDQIH
jgi:predicted Zn-dependent peptidase